MLIAKKSNNLPKAMGKQGQGKKKFENCSKIFYGRHFFLLKFKILKQDGSLKMDKS